MSDLESSTFSEVAANNSAASPNGAPEGMAPSGVNDTIREVMAAVKREWNRAHPTITAGGTANAITLTYTTAPAAYVQGQSYTFIAAGNNSGATTINVNGLGATAVTKNGASALIGGEILTGAVVTVRYDGTRFQLVEGVLGATLPTLTNHALQVGAGTTTPIQLAAVALGKFLGSQGVGADPAYISAVATVKQQNFTANGTYTPSTGMLFCLILALGAGGGGGGATSGQQNQAGGGGAGQLAIVLATAATIGASKSVTIGTGGTAGANTGGTGGTGGNTSVGTVAVGNGGSGGVGSSGVSNGTLGGLGGTGGTSDIATTGAAGGWSYQASTGIAGISGMGGSTIFGGGGNSQTSGNNGNNGTGFGSGGSGANGNGGAHAGGVGSAGVVYIIEFCAQ
jgi:hypothetical protein